jgi:cysteine-rich repeat protein
MSKTTAKRTILVPTSIVVSLLAFSLDARAEPNGCGQPVSTGAGSTVSDCRFILLRALESELVSCPSCVCDLDRSGAVAATDLLRCIIHATSRPMAVDCPSCSLGAGATTATIAGTSPTAPTTTLGGPLTNYDVLFTIGEAVFVGALQFETDYATAAANSQGNFVGTGQAADCEVVPDLGLGFPAFNNCIGPNACGLLGPDTLVAAITSVSGFNTEVGETVVRCTWASVTQPSAGDFEITVVDASDPTTSPISVTVDIGQIAAQDGGAICGNGVIEPGEFCDDGNTISGDGCDSNCLIESPSGNCQIRFGVTNAEVLGALSYDTDYFNAPGEFSGSGGAVECTSLSGDLAAFNDCDTADACPTIPFASRSLASAVISAGGFNTPADMAVCSFVATTIPQPTDFLITVTDATRPDFSPAFANVEVTDISCAATCIDLPVAEIRPAERNLTREIPA